MTLAIEVVDLEKWYGTNHALRGVSFAVEEGEVFALLGPNGAGKSTTVEILEGHREASAGSVEVLGVDPATGGLALRDRIGIVLQMSGSESLLTPREAVDVYGAAYSRRLPTDEVLATVGLTEKADDRIGSLSGGQQRRLDLALGLVGSPELIFLDEPTTGFDPSARRRAWELVDRLRGEGRTILLTTHYMDEAQHLADRVAVIAQGEIVATGRPGDLGGPSETVVGFVVPTGVVIPEALLAKGHVTGNRFSARTARPTAFVGDICAWATGLGLELEGLTVTRPTLEDVYLELTEPGAEAAAAEEGGAHG